VSAYTITLCEEDAHLTDAVRKAAEREELTNPNLNGYEIVVEEGDFTCVDGPDELVGVALLDMVSGLREEQSHADYLQAEAEDLEDLCHGVQYAVEVKS